MSRPWLIGFFALASTLLGSVVVAQSGGVDGPTPPEVTQDSENDLPTVEEQKAEAEAALRGVEGLRNGDVEIEGGVPVVRGIANDDAVRDEASGIVRRVFDADDVRNDVTLSGDFGERVEGAASRVGDRIDDWLGYLPLIPVAIVIVVVAFLLAWVAGRWRWLYGRLSSNPFLNDIARRLVQSAVVLGGVLLALEVLNAMALVGGVLGAAGVAGIAIGFAFKDLIENYIASVLLSLRQPFRPRDHVVIDGHEGLVTSMNSRTTVLTTFDGNVVRIPNATVFKTTLINYTSDSRRRFSFDVGVGYDVDLGEAVRVGVEVLTETEGVMDDPGPFAIVTKLGDSSISITLFGWVDQAAHDFGKVRSSAMQRVKMAYDDRDIDMPEPIYSVKLTSPGKGGATTPVPPESTHDHARRRSVVSTSVHDISRDDTAETLADEANLASEDEDLLTAGSPRE